MQKQIIIPFLMCHIQIYFSVQHRYMHFSNILCVFDVIPIRKEIGCIQQHQQS